eukprot:g32553.t1
MVDELSALGLRHVGYAVPIELFAPFTDCCVAVMKPLIAEIPKVEYAIKIIWCPADGSHEIADAYLTILENCYVLKLALPAAPTSDFRSEMCLNT